jgi:1,4-alpha-glucan branching enzyme
MKMTFVVALLSLAFTTSAEPPKLTSPNVTLEGVTFSYFDPDAFSVSVTGDFNQWSINSSLMQRDKQGVWSVTLPIKPGRYEYQYNVNGIYWKHDPANTNKATGSLGSIKSVLVVKDTDLAVAPATTDTNNGPRETKFSYVDPLAKKVAVVGFFNNWSHSANVMTNDGKGLWMTVVTLKPGNHGYKFWVDGKLVLDPSNPVAVADGFGWSNSVVKVGN